MKKQAVKKPTPNKQIDKRGPRTDLQRLQRAMAAAGFGSRRECETLITEGRVEVDGTIVNKLGTKVDPFAQKIFVDGQKLSMPRHKYFVLNKPPGVVSTSKDPSGRLRVIDLIKTEQRVYNVGRLDQSSEGLILVTNDGDLANQLTHPRFGIEKTYLVQVQGTPTAEKLKSLVAGVYLAEGKARVSNIKFKRRSKDTSWLEIVLDEGRNREIRRLLARVGHKVLRLRRIAIGPLRLGDLPVGAHRELTPMELKSLRNAVSGNPRRRVRFGKKAGTRTSPSDSRGDRTSGARPVASATRRKKTRRAGNPAPKSHGRSTARVADHPASAARKKSKRKSTERATGWASGKPGRTKKRGKS
jgi:23S rRNA pseudouridine2605 synthase